MSTMSDQELYNHLGIKLKRLRQDKGLSLLALSLDIGISDTHLSDLENGKRAPSLSFLNTFLKYYGLSWASFFSDIENPK